MQQPGRELPSRAGFALDEHCRGRDRDVFDQRPDFPYGPAAPDQRLPRIGGASGRVRGVPPTDSIYFRDKLLGRERPQKHIRYAILQRLDRNLGAGPIRDQ